MTPIFRYNASRQVLVEQATVQAPDYNLPFGKSLSKAVAEYKDHIASLREYPVAPGDWKEDVEYVEGKNFKVINVYTEPSGIHCNRGYDTPTAFLIPVEERNYSYADLIAAAEKAWDACQYSAVNHTMEERTEFKKQYFSQMFNHEIK